MLVSSKEVFNKQANYYNKRLHPFKGKAGGNKMGLLVGAWLTYEWLVTSSSWLKQNKTRTDDWCTVATDDLKAEGMLIAAEISWVIQNTLTSSKFFPESAFTITPIDFLVRSNSRVATLLAALLHHWQHPSNSSSSSNYYLLFKKASRFFLNKGKEKSTYLANQTNP